MPPTLVKSDALLLRRFRHGDTSLVVHAFTRTHGRVPFIAKGARAGGRRPPVPLVPVVLLELIWKPSTKSELQLLREWSLLDGFGEIHSDFEKLAWAQAAMEVLGRTITGEEPHEDLFDSTREYLAALQQREAHPVNLLLRFQVDVLRELGYELNLSLPPGSGTIAWYHPSRGALVTRDPGGASVEVHQGSWKLLQALAAGSYGTVGRIKVRPDARREIQAVLDAAFRHAFQRWGPLESLRLLEPWHEPTRTSGDTGAG